MQCPPSPGPGENFMNPNGFVAAASITSHTLTPNLSQITAISLTRPMLIMRNVFSSSLVSSAASGELTGTTSSMNSSYTCSPNFVQRSVMPPSTLGVFLVCQRPLPGSTRSGEKQRKKSSPTCSSRFSNVGSSTSRVVPGYVVDSSTTSWPGRSASATDSVAVTTNDMSGSFVLPNGVGTQIEMTSHSPKRDMSNVASSLPLARSAATSPAATSLMWLPPPFTRSATRADFSKPITCRPAFPISTASGSPTYPIPTTPHVTRRWPILSDSASKVLMT